MDVLEMLMPLPKDLQDVTLPSPEEVTYWEGRVNRTFYIDYEIDDDYSLIELSKIIIQMNIKERDIPQKDLKPIYIWIQSYGGDLNQACYFADLLMASRIPIITIAMGAAMSSGCLVLLAGHKRYAFKHSQLLVHSGSASFSGSHEQLEEAQKNYKKTIEKMKEYILSRTTIDEKTFNKNKTKDWYFTADELVKYHIVDKLIEKFEDIFE